MARCTDTMGNKNPARPPSQPPSPHAQDTSMITFRNIYLNKYTTTPLNRLLEPGTKGSHGLSCPCRPPPTHQHHTLWGQFGGVAKARLSGAGELLKGRKTIVVVGAGAGRVRVQRRQFPHKGRERGGNGLRDSRGLGRNGDSWVLPTHCLRAPPNALNRGVKIFVMTPLLIAPRPWAPGAGDAAPGCGASPPRELDPWRGNVAGGISTWQPKPSARLPLSVV